MTRKISSTCLVRWLAANLIPLFYLLLTYSVWWGAPVASLLIIALAGMAWPARGLQTLGLAIPRSQAGRAFILACGIAASAWVLIRMASGAQGVLLVPVWQRHTAPYIIAHTVGQTLNEEMVLGALLLKAITAKLPRLRRVWVSAGVAFVFALLHAGFYTLRPAQDWNYGILSPVTLLSIFLVGLIRNNFILGYGNIAYAWAVHLGWNLVFIDSAYYWIETGQKLAEPAIFNVVFGNGWIALALGAFLLISRLPKITTKIR